MATKKKAAPAKKKAAPAKQKAAPAKKKGAPAKKKAAKTPSASIGADVSVAELWSRIERWFAEHHPDLDLMLRPPASEAQIAAAEEALGVRFPDDYRASLAVHDGQDDTCDVNWLPVAQRLGSLESIVRCFKDDRAMYSDDDDNAFDDDERVRQVHLHPRHIPIAGSAYWDYDRLMLDFAPGPNGTDGQVIARIDIDIEHIAPSFRALLAQTLQDLERGKRKPWRSG